MTKEEELKARAVIVEMQDKYFMLGFDTAIIKARDYIRENVFRYMPFVEESVKEKIIDDFKEAMKL